MSKPYHPDIIRLVTEENDALVLGDTHLLQQLTEYINHLIENDFPLLVQLLYRLDIPEKILKENIHHHQPEDAGHIIAVMIIERQVQKIDLRKKHQQKDDISEEEKW